MILVGKETKRSTTWVLEQAVNYFGPRGLGLDVTHWDAAGVQLQGGGGFVEVRAQRQPRGRTGVEIESREWENAAQHFLRKI